MGLCGVSVVHEAGRLCHVMTHESTHTRRSAVVGAGAVGAVAGRAVVRLRARGDLWRVRRTGPLPAAVAGRGPGGHSIHPYVRLHVCTQLYCMRLTWLMGSGVPLNLRQE